MCVVTSLLIYESASDSWASSCLDLENLEVTFASADFELLVCPWIWGQSCPTPVLWVFYVCFTGIEQFQLLSQHQGKRHPTFLSRNQSQWLWIQIKPWSCSTLQFNSQLTKLYLSTLVPLFSLIFTEILKDF